MMPEVAQTPLPGTPPAPMTIDVFFDEWVKAHPDEAADPWKWVAIRAAMSGDLPRRLLPNSEVLVDGWWTNTYNRLCQKRGIRRQDIAKTEADEADENTETEDANQLAIGLRWRQAAFEEFFAWSVTQARRAVIDLEAVDVRVDVYAADHPELNIDTAQIKLAIRIAAGLVVAA